MRFWCLNKEIVPIPNEDGDRQREGTIRVKKTQGYSGCVLFTLLTVMQVPLQHELFQYHSERMSKTPVVDHSRDPTDRQPLTGRPSSNYRIHYFLAPGCKRVCRPSCDCGRGQRRDGCNKERLCTQSTEAPAGPSRKDNQVTVSKCEVTECPRVWSGA